MIQFKNGEWYEINGVPCQYNDGLFFWESEDGTKWFRESSVRESGIEVKHIENNV